ncbi:hypothetical protein BDQ17DRAFT_1231332 [Cyathus striatus]|nr:hypothetical protein BDQ17DRAFT_1231332 [Cyathus striatus]
MSSSKDVTESKPTSAIPPAPTPGQKPTGNLLNDSVNAAVHLTEIPCARSSLLAGIASGAGIGVIRGLTAGPMVAGNWAVATFMLVSIGSWHICQNQFANERKQLKTITENMPRLKLKRSDEVISDTEDANSSKSVS